MELLRTPESHSGCSRLFRLILTPLQIIRVASKATKVLMTGQLMAARRRGWLGLQLVWLIPTRAKLEARRRAQGSGATIDKNVKGRALSGTCLPQDSELKDGCTLSGPGTRSSLSGNQSLGELCAKAQGHPSWRRSSTPES
jgi:hypothetical protein